MLFADGCERADFLFRIHCARGVAGRIEDEELGFGRDRRFELFGRDFQPVLFTRFHIDGNAAQRFDDFGIGEPIGRGNDDLVPFVDERVARVENGVLRAVGDDDLRGFVFKSVVALEFFADRAAQFGQSRRGRVLRFPLLKRLDARFDDMRGRGEIGFADAEIDDALAGSLHCLRLCADRQRLRRRNGLNPLCQPFFHTFIPLTKKFFFILPRLPQACAPYPHGRARRSSRPDRPRGRIPSNAGSVRSCDR